MDAMFHARSLAMNVAAPATVAALARVIILKTTTTKG